MASRLAIGIALAIVFFTLAAFLGQLDWQLSYWYTAPNAMWCFPWACVPAVYAWEFEYAIILTCAVAAFVLGYLLGRAG